MGLPLAPQGVENPFSMQLTAVPFPLMHSYLQTTGLFFFYLADPIISA